MKSITLNNGYEYRSFWGGEYIGKREPRTNGRITICGERSMMRKYHTLRKVNEGGRDWIIERQTQPAPWESKYFNHFDVFSTDGRFHIARYRSNGGYGWDWVYKIYEAYTWRDNMQSTFGNHVKGVGDREFTTLKEAMNAVKDY